MTNAAMAASLENVREAFEEYRAETLAILRDEALATYERKGHPISVNDLRPYFESMGYEGDPRILGSVFRRCDGWVPVGAEMGDSSHVGVGRTVRLWRRN